MIKRYLPFLSWMATYNKSLLRGDLIAGLTVGIMLVPQGMAYAMIAGMPPIYGLYAALVPPLVYALMGTSRQLGVGPVAMDSLLVAAGVGALQLVNTEEYISTVLFLTLLIGGIQLLLGILRMGFFVNFLSKPVISGFTSAAAILIGLGQLKHILGSNFAQSSKIHELVGNIIGSLDNVDLLTLGLGAISIFLMFLLKIINKKLPAPLLIVVLGILAVVVFNLETKGIYIVGDIPEGLPDFQLPQFQWDKMGQLMPIAITVALFGFMESVSIAKTVEEKHPEYELDADQELRALGLSNILGSFFQSFSVSGSFSRTAVNDQTGAKTGMSLIFSTLIIAGVLLFLTPLFYKLPAVVLGAIIIVSVVGLIDIKYPLVLWKNRKDEFFLLTATFLMTLFIGLMEGILLGVLLSLMLLVYRISKPHMAVLGKVRGTHYYKNIDRFSEDVEVDADKLVIRFDAQLYFGNKDYFKKQLYRQIEKKGPVLKYIILNAEPINYIDSSAASMLERIILDLRKKGIHFFIAAAIGPTRDILYSSGIVDILGEENLFVQTFDAVDCCTEQKERSLMQKKVSLQSKTKSL
ncbi:solute carrier family 26 protein [Flagellimonas halotolerans]|uniref:Solute carrier family 26 protein n=1 Tax=Flagellimonas halotolerans TaxID=3112164 RepID=A0ABU6IM06_9FLAO|nr:MULTISPECIES: solute carrier family 26 protein [unclassified Allomuricauda]MEC3964191.1 solute carrier family 26 protein [Muricauda sp. SYSU M86414]MEC4264061.1 solute carrier family 26 protein [Muricauda sp. SYSU M84420]